MRHSFLIALTAHALFSFSYGCQDPTEEADYPNKETFTADPIISLTTGEFHTCALRQTGKVYCWGRNDKGQLGAGFVSTTAPASIPTGTVVTGLPPIKHITSGKDHTCGLDDNKTVWCWGSNTSGQLGRGDLSVAFSPTPTQIPNFSNVLQLSSGHQHTCAITSDKQLYCWGSNASKQSNNTASTAQPLASPTLNNHTDFTSQAATRVFAGGEHTCAIRADNSVRCFGKNNASQVQGSTTTSPNAFVTPSLPAEALSNTALFSLGAEHTCLLTQNGSVLCFGQNTQKQCATCANNTQCPASSGGITAMQSAEKIVTAYNTTCALLKEQAFCWGNNTQDQIHPTASNTTADPTLVSNTHTFKDIAPGSTHTCALSTDGIVYCWGNNTYGQLGIGNYLKSDLLTGVKGIQ